MKQLLRLSIFTFLLLIISSSCKKKVTEVTEVNQDYVGSWSSNNADALYNIYVGSDSKGAYLKLKGNTKVTAEGTAKLDGDKFKIGPKNFDVNQHPIMDTAGVYTMILDDITYYRYW